ncbi:MAG: FAD-dependent monooxygenase [Alphaproteobacteria bacterium]|nr:FAD-dependent monooxygenase [Alphaproteobacteria bacterium]
MIRLNHLKFDLDFDFSKLGTVVAKFLKVEPKEILSFALAKKSVDARQKNYVHFVCSVDVEVANEDAFLMEGIVEKVFEKQLKFPKISSETRPVIVGTGPAGMFAGIVLAEAGLRPILIERGQEVSQRQKDVEVFWQTGKLNEESNVQFGEGGAGTFSDGKLMSGIKKDEMTLKVLHELVEAGAPSEILYLAKPHIGTDFLAIAVKNIRKKIEALGGEYCFGTKLKSITSRNNKLIATTVQAKDEIFDLATENLVLAIGHSARDTFEMIHEQGLQIEQKAFSVGARIEHRQELINKAQFGNVFYSHPALGAADYKQAVHLSNGRSCYSFCMCPGGVVVAAASEKGHVATNGMSYFRRDKENANAAILVGVTPKDYESSHPLAGMYFQRKLEARAFEIGGKTYAAPAQLVGDFLKGRESKKLGEVKPSYQPNVTLTNLSAVLPDYVVTTMQQALLEMNKKIKGFAGDEAVLTGVETRSSSPIRILRDENLESNVKGIYPCGEGAGYAGGIMSAAVDGIKVALKIIEKGM